MTDHDHSNKLSVLTLPELMTLHGLLVRYADKYSDNEWPAISARILLGYITDSIVTSFNNNVRS